MNCTYNNSSLIRLESIRKAFLTDEVETQALAGIDLDVKRGEFVCITGPSGCGKSALLSIIGLFDPPSGGRYLLNGQAVHALNHSGRASARNREIGFVSKSFDLIRDLTVYENVELPLTYRDISASERRRRVMEALGKVGMDHRAKHLPFQLSGGQQQRVVIARAIGGSPSVLLADEPTGSLDSRNGEAVMGLLSELHRHGSTIVLATHDARVARHATRSVHLLDGGIVDELPEVEMGLEPSF